MVCGDPHQPLGSPIRFFAQHLNTQDKGGNFDVVGFGFAGTPGVQLGHNRTVGWTAWRSAPSTWCRISPQEDLPM